ncbi:MAG: cob(I)yrinic acid a,c-diamide adenosyltransferase [Patescibacteria group bacterium]|mgnify:CR=1 FL=1
MLFTGKGDSGETSLFGSSARISKNSSRIQALGSLDELNSWLGVCKAKAGAEVQSELAEVQQNLFIIQAELAGVPKNIEESKVKNLGERVEQIEKLLPAIHTFFLPGGSELAAHLDYARTVARRAERSVIGEKLGEFSLAYLNRLSSLLYALARLENHKSGIKEEKPTYE